MSKHYLAEHDACPGNLLGEITTDRYFYTPVPCARTARTGCANVGWVEAQYSAIYTQTRGVLRHTPTLHAVGNAKAWPLALDAARAKGGENDFAFWCYARSSLARLYAHA